MPRETSDTKGRRCGEAGYSIVEVLIAAGLVLFIAVGVLPMFTMALQSNLQGSDSTNAANHVRARLEEFMGLPFDAPELTIAAGTENVFDEVYSENTESWLDGTVVPAGDSALWTRRTTVRQYNATDVTLTTPLPSTVDPEQIHIKEIVVEVQSTRVGGVLGGGKTLAVRAMKAL